jgi:hypothetical protein
MQNVVSTVIFGASRSGCVDCEWLMVSSGALGRKARSQRKMPVPSCISASAEPVQFQLSQLGRPAPRLCIASSFPEREARVSCRYFPSLNEAIPMWWPLGRHAA